MVLISISVSAQKGYYQKSTAGVESYLNYSIVKTIPARVRTANAIAFDDVHSLWVSSNSGSKIYNISDNGDLVNYIDPPDYNGRTAGVAFASPYLWVSDNTVHRVFKMHIPCINIKKCHRVKKDFLDGHS